MLKENNNKATVKQNIKANEKADVSAKPFVKWAGGKSQLLKPIAKELPSDINNSKGFTYMEPFVGSGAVLFWILNNYNNVKKAVINDINEDLTKCYKTIQSNIDELIVSLKDMENKYYSIKEKDRKNFFLEKREEFNKRKKNSIQHAGLLIFLNKTCFNGLYRVNSKNEFNVPFGDYKNPKILDTENLLAVNKALRNVIILNKDFTETLKEINNDPCFFYLDPPYKPISKSSAFNAYSQNGFDDEEQKRLKEFLDTLNAKNIYWLLSNSDLKNIDPEDEFFDNLYQEFNISRVKAKRAINSNGRKRGKIYELLIKNY
ncbi:MAG: DNA adenine methylase [Bacteroidales bacterium]